MYSLGWRMSAQCQVNEEVQIYAAPCKARVKQKIAREKKVHMLNEVMRGKAQRCQNMLVHRILPPSSTSCLKQWFLGIVEGKVLGDAINRSNQDSR
jgi:hypothetical protein